MQLCKQKAKEGSTMQEEGLPNEGRHHLLLFYKQAHDKRGIAEPLHAYLDMARQTIFERNITTLKKYAHPPL